MNCNAEQSLRRVWGLFKAPDAILEVRALDCSGKHKAWSGWATSTLSGYFDDADAFFEAVTGLDKAGRASGIYVTLNPVQPDLLARANNRLVAAKRGETTDDAHILARRWILLDFDPVRPAGISSTDAELKRALESAKQARAQLSNMGWPLPVMACSGNGIHLLYRVDLANDESAREGVKATLQSLAERFSGEAVSLDTGVFNAGRIVKCYGTVARKGDATADRRHRRALILEEMSG